MREHRFHSMGRLVAALLLCFGPVWLTAADAEAPIPGDAQKVTLIKAPPEILTRQRLRSLKKQ